MASSGDSVGGDAISRFVYIGAAPEWPAQMGGRMQDSAGQYQPLLSSRSTAARASWRAGNSGTLPPGRAAALTPGSCCLVVPSVHVKTRIHRLDMPAAVVAAAGSGGVTLWGGSGGRWAEGLVWGRAEL